MIAVNVVGHATKARAGVARATSLLSLFSATALLCTTALVSPGSAANVSWTGAADGNWFNASNWSTNAVPGVNDNAMVGMNVVGAAVLAAGATSLTQLIVGNNFAGALTIQAGGSLAVSSVATIGGGLNAGASGVLTLQGGGSLTSNAASIGYIAGSTGTATVTGTGSIWQLGSLRLGQSGSGSLTISDGGQVLQTGGGFISTNSSAVGIATVTGVGSAWSVGSDQIIVGWTGGKGTLNIEAGGTVNSVGFVAGYAASTTGDVLVDGTGSSLHSAGPMDIGLSGTGTLTISNGGQVTGGLATGNSYFNIATNSGSNGRVEVNGTGSSLNIVNRINVGNSGSGALTVSNGGAVAGTALYVGNSAAAVGTVLVDGAGSSLSAASVNFGVGSGALTVSDGGTVVAGQFVKASGAVAARISLDGGTLKASADQANFLSGFAAGDTTLNTNGGTIDTNGHAVGIGGVLSGIGGLTKVGAGTLTLSGLNTYSGGTTVEAGTLLAGAAGAFLGDASYTVNGGSLNLNGYGLTMATLNGLGGTVALGGAALTVNQAVDTSYAGAITGSGSLTKTGSGTLVLTGANSWQGTTSINGGVLQLGDDVAGGANTLGGPMQVNAGATLGISLNSTVTTTGSVSFNAGSTFSIDATSVNVSLNAASVVINPSGSVLNIAGIVASSDVNDVLIHTTGGITGDFGAVKIGGFAGPVDYLDLNTSKSVDGNDYLLTYSLSWTANNNLAHGTFTLTNATDHFMVGADLHDEAPNVVLGWNGQTLTKAGAGILILTGTNTYTGGTVISDGRLVGSATSFGTGNILDNGVLVLNQGSDASFGNIISGSGSLTKTGDGTLTLTGANTYSGGTSIEAGALEVASAANLGTGGLALSGAGTLKASGSFILGQDVTLHTVNGDGGGTFDVAAAQGLTLSGPISGDGVLTKTGDGVLVLTGTNVYSGGTAILAGTLEATSAANLGTGALALSGAGILKASGSFTLAQDVALAAVSGTGGGTFEVAAGQGLTLSGTVSGDGALTKTGAGVLTLTGTNTYAGGTTITSGTLRVGDGGTSGSITGDVFNSANLVFDRSDSTTFTGSISGSGTVTITGGGTLSLAAPTEGTVLVTGASALLTSGPDSMAAFTVVNGFLGGTGTIGALTMNSGGVVAPSQGGVLGTLTVSGPVTFNQGSIYTVGLMPDGSHDLISASGAVTLSDGAHVQVTAIPGTYPVSQQVAILTTTGTVTGTFGSVLSDYAFLTPQLSYDEHNVYLLLTYSGIGIGDYARTPNEANIADGVQELGPGHPVFDAVISLPREAVRPALNQLSGEAHASSGAVLLDQSIYLRAAVEARLRQGMGEIRAGTPSALSYADSISGPASTQLFAGWTPSMWAQGYGGWGNSFSNVNAASLSSNVGGFFAGIDALVSEHVRVGVVGGYSQSTYDVKDRASSGRIDNYDLGLYAGTKVGWLDLKGGVSYTWHDLNISRSIVFPGFVGATGADYSEGTTQVFGRASTRFAVAAYEFEPFVDLAYVNMSGANTAERAVTPAALAVNLSDMNTFYTTLGTRAATSVEIGGVMLAPSVSLGWQHAFGDVAQVSTMQFLDGATPFRIEGLPIARDTAILGAGLAYNLSDKASLQLTYLGQVATSATNTTFSARLGVEF